MLGFSLGAQTELGQISGVVTYRSRQPVPLAAIRVLPVAGGVGRSASASRQGIYEVASLPPGDYTVEVSAPSLAPLERRVTISPGARIREDFLLDDAPARPQSAPEIVSPGNEVSSQEQHITHAQIEKLPDLTRNPYQFVELAGNLSDAGLGTRGAGFAINGQRESSTNILLDGANNNNEFAGSIGQQVPLDAIREFVVITSGFTAEYGRASGGIVNVVTESGSNQVHGSGYEFNRSSSLSSNSFLNNSQGLSATSFSRNQFGYAVGGPVIRNRLFFFSGTEISLVRSDVTALAWTPTPQLLALTAPNTQAFFQSLGQLRSRASILGTISLSNLTAAYGANPCTGLACATIPASLPLLNHVAYSAPAISSGGFPQSTVDTLARVDYDLGARTWIYARYALYREADPAGVLSSSPYANYDLGQSQWNQTFALSVNRAWSTAWNTQTKVDFNRLSIFQQGLTSRGIVPTMYANPLAPVAIGTDYLAFPGYNPFAPGSGGAFGGPENLLQINQDAAWIKGRHTIRLGGSFDTIRDNRTDAAYQTAVDSLSNGGGLGPALNGLLAGQFAQIEVAIDPQGRFPCVNGAAAPACTLNLPAGPPNFSRSNIFNDGSLYVQDYWKVRRTLTVNLGVRWEYFGVQHDRNPKLDSNWYAPGITFADNSLGAYLRNGGLQLAAQSPIGRLWQPQWKNFAPRVGFAWEVFGHPSMTIRGGYGIGYERNFGNVTFNVIQNLPNYAVLDLAGPVTTNNFGPLANSGAMPLPQVGARIIDPGIKTAYAHFWNAAFEREISRTIVYSLEYSGSKGVDLYSVSYPNQYGFGNFALGDPCTGFGDCYSPPNASYGENVGYRGNQGFSTYQSVNQRLAIRDLFHHSLSLTANYTFSHAIDNLSSTFFEAGGQGVANPFGNQNITINNGDFVAGLLDPYHPNLDRGDAEFDVRHRVVAAGVWQLPSWKKSGWMGSLARGWSIESIFLARSGQPFSVFDSSVQTLDLNAPRATFAAAHPKKRNTFIASPMPDLFHLITFLPAQIARDPNPLTPGASWPAAMSGRDSFRAPGFWNLDAGVHKNTNLSDRLTLQFRGELFNVLNHANLYVIGRSADVGKGNTIDACFGCTGSSYDQRQVQLAVKLLF